MAIIMLRLPFGGDPCPSKWSVISESTCNFTNAILHDDEWDPTMLVVPTKVSQLKLLDADLLFWHRMGPHR